MLMVFISVFLISFGVELQALCVLGVSFSAYLLQVYGNPFEEDDLNKMEMYATINATITLYGGVYFISGDLPQAVNYVFLALIAITNIVFIVYWAKILILEFLKQRKEAKKKKEEEKKLKDQAENPDKEDGNEEEAPGSDSSRNFKNIVKNNLVKKSVFAGLTKSKAKNPIGKELEDSPDNSPLPKDDKDKEEIVDSANNKGSPHEE